jgi:hypothetical protein
MSPSRRARFLFPAVLAALIALPATQAARADTQDIAAASRSVVRVALVATDGDSAYFVGHGSGIVVAPGKVLTNAHVVELTRSEPNIVLGIIPSAGSKSYGGRVVAFSPGNDLALVAFDPAANIPVATFFAGAPADGQQVTAIGYPGSVDRAQGMSLEDIIHPMSAVRTNGTVSGGRASKQFDTVLHTAPLATGNSGGPLVDDCGRVLGINSFGSVSDGNDAEYGFAVSDREIARFVLGLPANLKFNLQRSIEPCKSLAELETAQKIADEQARAQAAQRASREAIAARESELAERERSQQIVISRRENMMALAALLLAGAALAGAGAILSASRAGKRRIQLEILAGLLLIGAVLTFLLRPGFDAVEPAADNAAIANAAGENEAVATADDPVGDNLCRFEPALSRVTVSDTADVPFHWSGEGCINGQTQMVREAAAGGAGWMRIVVPDEDAVISIRRFDPATRSYRSDTYLVDADTLDQARTLRKTLSWNGCTGDPARLEALARLQGEISALLPPQPNERLAYRCRASAPPR